MIHDDIKIILEYYPICPDVGCKNCSLYVNKRCLYMAIYETNVNLLKYFTQYDKNTISHQEYLLMIQEFLDKYYGMTAEFVCAGINCPDCFLRRLVNQIDNTNLGCIHELRKMIEKNIERFITE